MMEQGAVAVGAVSMGAVSGVSVGGGSAPVHTHNGRCSLAAPLQRQNGQVLISSGPDESRPCAVCNSNSTKCKVFSCDHVICDGCRHRLPHVHENGVPESCPHCLQKSALPVTDELQEFNSDSDDSRTELEIEERALYCFNHSGQTLRFFCRDCESAICSSCTDVRHAGHAICRLSESKQLQRDALLRLKQSLTVKMNGERALHSAASEASARLSEAHQAARDQVDQYCASLVEAVRQRQTQLLDTLQQAYAQKKSSHDSVVDTLGTRLVELEACDRYIDHTLASGSDTQMLLLSKQVSMRIGAEPPPKQDSNSHLRFESTDPAEIQRRLETFGLICIHPASLDTTDAAGDVIRRCQPGQEAVVMITTRDSSGEVLLDGLAPIHAIVQDPCGDLAALPLVTVNRRKGTYRVAFTLMRLGTFYLHISLFQRPISNSPIMMHCQPSANTISHHASTNTIYHHASTNTIYHHASTNDVFSPADHRLLSLPVARSAESPSSFSQGTEGSRGSRGSRASLDSTRSRRSSRRSVPETPVTPVSISLPIHDDLVLSIGSKGRGKGLFANPQGVAYCSANDRLLVADSNNQCVQVFSLDGACKLRFGVRGRGVGQMQRPCGVVSTPQGHYVVTDYENRSASLHDHMGVFVRRIGHGKLQGPKGVTVDVRGNLLVVDNKGCSVLTFSPTGRLLSRFGCRGTAQHQFAGPHFAAVDGHGRIAVTDFHNHVVKVFSSDGRHLLSFGSHGDGEGLFNAPTGVTTDRHGNLLVADWGNSRVQVFDGDGRFITRINTSATPLYGPQGLAMSPEGHVIIADTGNHAVKLYSCPDV